jgi:hypothetical protein
MVLQQPKEFGNGKPDQETHIYIYRHKQHQVHHRWIAIGDPTIDGNPSWLLACIDCV